MTLITTTVVPAVTLPPVKLFSQQRYFELGPKKTRVKLFSPQLHYFFPPVTLFSYFPPQLSYFVPPSYAIFFLQRNSGEQNSLTGGKNKKIA
jgi:hypothetical protein